MKRTKIALLAIAVIALVASLMFVVGCSSSSASSAEKTLESYFKDHQSEWDSTVAQIKESGGEVMDVEMAVTGNKISQIMRFKQTYTDSQVATIKANIEAQVDGLKSQVTQQIAKMEQSSGIKGITWLFDYQNGDGKSIASFEWGSE